MAAVAVYSDFGAQEKKICHCPYMFRCYRCPCIELSLGFLEKLFSMLSMFSWQNPFSLCPLSFCTPRPNLLVFPNLLWISFDFLLSRFNQSPIMKKASFGISTWGVNLDNCSVEWYALEMNQDHSVIFEVASKYCILDSFVDNVGNSISPKGFLSAVIDINIMSSQLNLPIPVHFSSIIPKMLMFSLAVFCLATFHLPWFTGLSVQVLTQYCSL